MCDADSLFRRGPTDRDSAPSWRSFALIPAAGRSRRMGQPKLLLSWGGATVIDRVLAAWKASHVSAVIVTAHPDDEELIAHCRAARADVVVVDPPPDDMKASLAAGLAHVEAAYQPQASDVWLLAPADMPLLNGPLIDRILNAHDVHNPRAIVPRAGGRRGHPVLLPWTLANDVKRLAPNQGINVLVGEACPLEIDCDDLAAFADLDTPDDYERLRRGSGLGTRG